eukprot:83096-Chlamydomonas_euryale.AAC.7
MAPAQAPTAAAQRPAGASCTDGSAGLLVAGACGTALKPCSHSGFGIHVCSGDGAVVSTCHAVKYPLDSPHARFRSRSVRACSSRFSEQGPPVHLGEAVLGASTALAAPARERCATAAAACIRSAMLTKRSRSDARHTDGRFRGCERAALGRPARQPSPAASTSSAPAAGRGGGGSGAGRCRCCCCWCWSAAAAVALLSCT